MRRLERHCRWRAVAGVSAFSKGWSMPPMSKMNKVDGCHEKMPGKQWMSVNTYALSRVRLCNETQPRKST
jgi:hypothetical protein